MTTNKSTYELPGEQKQELEDSINDFGKWLVQIKKLRGDPATKYKKLSFPRPSKEDWIMLVKGNEVRFNTYVTNKCSFEYYRMIVLHEYFHLFVQDVPNKLDAKRIKDDFGEVVMKLLDIEADYYTAMYYKEVKRKSLIDIFSLNYEGSKIFGDPKIRQPKFERFIGSVLSIANAYFKNTGTKTTKENDLYLPNISSIPTEDRIHILISTDKHFLLGEIHGDIHDLYRLKQCYTRVNGAGVRYYVKTLLEFAAKALNEKITPAMFKELHELEDPAREAQKGTSADRLTSASLRQDGG